MLSKILLLKCIVLVLVLFVYAPLAAEENPVLASAGDYVFRKSDLDRLLSFSPPQFIKRLEQNPQQKVLIVRKLIEQKILADLARKEGIDKHEDVKEQMKYLVNDLLAREYLIKVMKKGITVTDDDVRRYYEKNLIEFHTPEQVRARHILIKVPFGASENVKKKANDKAEQILEWLKKGEKFETLAEQYSEDHNSKKKGGDLGYFPRGRMAKPFEDAVFSMKPGEISDIVETEYGYHIIMAEGRRPAITKTFDEVKDVIKKQMLDEMKRSKIKELIKKVTADAGLEIHTENIISKTKNE